jgi:formylglycine-generating enzyme required for sulfatase activity
MIAVPAGEFEMGSTDGSPDERPRHRVAVSAFAIDATEVTVRAYAACVDAGACRRTPKSDACNFGKDDKGDHPMNCVDWNDAGTFCAWGGKRLPSEEEWEYVARGDGRKYPWGDVEIGDRACWNRHGGKLGTCAVASHLAGDTPLGVHDLAGNVWEWTSSTFASDYGKPRGSSSLRVTRGGGWGSADEADLRTTTRGRRRPDHRSDVIGFRCAK